MKLTLAFLFISVWAVCFVAGQSETDQKSTMSNTDQQITNGPVAEYVSDSNCTIGWSTSAPGTMTVHYGTDRDKLTRTAEAVEGKDGRNYHVQLSRLSPNTRYYFRVLNGHEPVSGIGTFQTVSQSDPPIRSKAVIPQ